MQQRRHLSISNNYYWEFSGLFEVGKIIENAFLEYCQIICSVLNVISFIQFLIQYNRDVASGFADCVQLVCSTHPVYKQLPDESSSNKNKEYDSGKKTKTEDITSYFCTQEEKCLVVVVQITSMLQLKVQLKEKYISSFYDISGDFFNCFISKDFIHIFSANV